MVPGIGFTVAIDVDPAVTLTEQYAQRASNFAPVLEVGVASMVRELVRLNFLTRGSRSTPRWAPLRPSTIAQKRRLGYGRKAIMRRTDRLMDSLTKRGHAEAIVDVGPQGATYGTRVPYARPHQSGAPSRNLPRRQPIPDPQPRSFVNDVRGLLAAYLMTGRVR